MNNFTAVVNLCRDPEQLDFSGRTAYKLRLADNTPGKTSVTRFLNAIVSGPDVDTAARLKSGDSICITGTLQATEYKAKKDGKGVKKGQTMKSDEIPFAKILQVLKSESFFNQDADAPADETESTDAPDLGADAGEDDPLAGVL